MSDLIDEYFLKLACEISLPTSSSSSRRAENASNTKPYTRAQAKLEQEADSLPTQSLKTSLSNKKRSRKSEFDIFVDAHAVDTTPARSAKKSKLNGRVPLGVKVLSTNPGPIRVPRHSSQPFPFSPSDPLWEDMENYAQPFYMTPPSTPRSYAPSPGRSSPIPGRPFHTAGGLTQTPPPSPFGSPLRSTGCSSNTTHSRRASAAQPLPPLTMPRNMVLYDVMQLKDWKATDTEIKTAYKHIAKGTHPDKVTNEQKLDATHFMQTVNAAKEVLLDSTRRRAYHNNGKLPWAS
ncbi:hypothetical protein SVAN01_02097 [Stagonosporopsis vannaccii]|nr:hypothetical protein SVAN01_02097 [Stagonosporopsis vannaccii]